MYKFFKLLTNGNWKLCTQGESTQIPRFREYIEWCEHNNMPWKIERYDGTISSYDYMENCKEHMSYSQRFTVAGVQMLKISCIEPGKWSGKFKRWFGYKGKWIKAQPHQGNNPDNAVKLIKEQFNIDV